MRLFVASVVMGCAVVQGLWAQDVSSAKMAESVMREWPAGVVTTVNKPGEWAYEEGVLPDGTAAHWHATADGDDFRYIKAAVDKYVAEDGTIKGYKADGHTLDDIEMGRAVLLVYRVTQQPKYYEAAKFLYDQLALQPRTASGGYWHKKIYPNQMWLDGAYMAEPFRAAYAATFQEPGDFDDIAKQLLLMDAKMRDPKTGLLLHGWDESKQMPWADKTTGLSPEVWARAMGWYAMALVDVLDWFPKDHPQRRALLAALNRTDAAGVKYQDAKSGLWWQVMDKEGEPGNYPEASASCMFAYSLAKGVRMGYLPPGDEDSAKRGWEGIQRQFVTTGADGLMVLNGTVKVGGLGGTPYRSGSYEYYVGEKTQANDSKGIGAFLLAGSEMEQAPTTGLGRDGASTLLVGSKDKLAVTGQPGARKTVLLDAWFNSQTRKNAAGETE